MIVNVSSIAQALPVPYVGGYGASKAALGYLSDAAAIELCRDDIAVVKVMPGLTDTGFGPHTRTSGLGASLDSLVAQADMAAAIPPERVAEEIWEAVRTGRSTGTSQTLRDRLMVLAGRLAPGAANALLKLAVARYVSADGRPSEVGIRGDLKRLKLLAGGVVVAATALIAVLLGRRRRQRTAMAASVDAEDLRRLRLRSQRLIPEASGRSRDVADLPRVAAGLVHHLCGIQAQDRAAAVLAVRPRTEGVTAVDVEDARVTARSFVRTWCMRGTLHLVATEDVHWLLDLLAPTMIRQSRRRSAQLGLSEETYGHAVDAIREVLGAEGPLIRSVLAEKLARRDIPVAGQAIASIVRRAALERIVCLGPDQGAEPTYVLFDEWVTADSFTLDKETALGRLVLRYLAAFGPAGVEDFAAWSGLGIRESRSGFATVADRLVELHYGDVRVWMPRESGAASVGERGDPARAILLSAFDQTMLGYRDRSWIVPPEYDREVNRGGGMIRPVVLVDGIAAGIWRLVRRTRGVTVEVTPFEPLEPATILALEEEGRDLSRFLDVTVRLDVL